MTFLLKRLSCVLILALSPVTLHAGDFLLGANLIDWNCNSGSPCNFGRDIGTNGWTDMHLSMHGHSGAPLFRKEKWLRMLTDLSSAGANFVRIPLMTQGQGILWEPWVNGRKNKIRGADPIWIENIVFLLNQAQLYGIKVQLNFLTGNTPKPKNHFYEFFYGKQFIINDPETRRDYLNKVITPLLMRVKNHPAFVQADVFGEANGTVFEDWSQSKDAIRSFIVDSHRVVKRYAPHVKTTASLGYVVTPGEVRKFLVGTGVDFYQLHLYTSDPEGGIDDCSQWVFDKPVLLGECGMSGPISGDPTGERSRYRQYVVTMNYFRDAKRCGFMGAAVWAANPNPPTYNQENGFREIYFPDMTKREDMFSLFRLIR